MVVMIVFWTVGLLGISMFGYEEYKQYVNNFFSSIDKMVAVASLELPVYPLLYPDKPSEGLWPNILLWKMRRIYH